MVEHLAITAITMFVIFIILFVLDTFFGPSPTTLEAQRRLYEEDIKKARMDYEAAVEAKKARMDYRAVAEAEMERIRRARRISRNEPST